MQLMSVVHTVSLGDLPLFVVQEEKNEHLTTLPLHSRPAEFLLGPCSRSQTLPEPESVYNSVADPDFELRWGPGFGLLALPVSQ